MVARKKSAVELLIGDTSLTYDESNLNLNLQTCWGDFYRFLGTSIVFENMLTHEFISVSDSSFRCQLTVKKKFCPESRSRGVFKWTITCRGRVNTVTLFDSCQIHTKVRHRALLTQSNGSRYFSFYCLFCGLVAHCLLQTLLRVSWDWWVNHSLTWTNGHKDGSCSLGLQDHCGS